MNIQELNSYKSPEEAAQERKDKRTFWPRLLMVGVLSAIGAFFVCGVLDIFGAYWAVFGLLAFVLGMVLMKEIRT